MKLFSFTSLLIILLAGTSCASYISREDVKNLKHKKTRTGDVTKKFGAPEIQTSARGTTAFHYKRCKRSAWDYVWFLEYIPLVGNAIRTLRANSGVYAAVKLGKELTYVKQCSTVTLKFNRRDQLIKKSFAQSVKR